MDQKENKRFDKRYQRHLQMLKLQGKSEKTQDAYARAIRRLRDRFDCCPDKLTPNSCGRARRRHHPIKEIVEMENIRDHFACSRQTHKYAPKKLQFPKNCIPSLISKKIFPL